MSTEQDAREDADTNDLAVRRALVECHADLLSFLRHRLRDPGVAEDVMHEGVLRALRSAPTLKDPGNTRSWLRRIMFTSAMDYYRNKKRHEERECPLPESIEDELADAREEAETVACLCLYKLLPTLPPSYSNVLWRADLLNQPREQIALDAETSVGNITVRLHRARRMLRDRLLQSCQTCPVHGFLDCRCDAAPSML